MPTELKCWRKRGIRSLVLALALLAGAWIVEVDVYRVRGASMYPLLRDDAAAGDRIVTLAHRALWSPLERFDVVVFQRPEGVELRDTATDLTDELCVKRIVALAGERPIIRGGDIYIERDVMGRRETVRAWRSSARILEMVSIVDSLSDEIEARFRWRASGNWERQGGLWRGTAAVDGALPATLLEFDEQITDAIVRGDGSVDPGGERVNDTGLRITVADSSIDTEIVFELREQGDTFFVTLSRTAPARIERRRVTAPPEILGAGTAASALPGGEVEVTVLNCDDRILVYFGERIGIDLAYSENEEVLGVARNDPSLRVGKGVLSITSAAVVRDAHFLTTTPLGKHDPTYGVVREGGYFLLGDNSRNSIDSRDYGAVDGARLRGAVVLRSRRDERWRWL